MNIIKFKDVINYDDALYNTYLKGKYAYWIQMRYIIPFEFITSAQYVDFENDISKLTDWRECGKKKPDPYYWDLNRGNLEAYVDVEATESANNIMPFMRANKFTTDPDITLDEVKKFRTWLATSLLDFDRNRDGEQKYHFYDEDFTAVLQYYANGMYDVTCKRLSKIKPGYTLTAEIKSCGCGGSDLSGLYKHNGDLCDPLYIYRKSIWSAMCEKFGDMDFWMEFPISFLKEFKVYIDNILSLNLPLTKSKYLSAFLDCTCNVNPQQGLHTELLKCLSNSLGYIINDEVRGNKNYITKSFQKWASDLYEDMEWA